MSREGHPNSCSTHFGVERTREERSTDFARGYSNWTPVRGPFEISGVHSRSLVDPLIPFYVPFVPSVKSVVDKSGSLVAGMPRRAHVMPR